MSQYFVNFSNHPSDSWVEEQKKAAKQDYDIDEIVDCLFPSVSASADKEEIKQMAEHCITEIMAYNPGAVMAQGEFGLTFEVVRRLKEKGIPVVYACSARNVREIQTEGGGYKKEVYFQFIRFREY